MPMKIRCNRCQIIFVKLNYHLDPPMYFPAHKGCHPDIKLIAALTEWMMSQIIKGIKAKIICDFSFSTWLKSSPELKTTTQKQNSKKANAEQLTLIACFAWQPNEKHLYK